MNNRLKHPPTIQLPSNRFEEPIEVDVDAYFEFSFWMSAELLELENRFAPKTANQPTTKVSH